jgi:nitrate/nitrite transporter NarK
VTAVLLISAGSFCAAFAGPSAYVVTIDTAGEHVPVVFGVMNMFGNFGAALFPLTVPYFVRFIGHWDSVLFLFAAVHVAAALCWVMIMARPIKSATYS